MVVVPDENSSIESPNKFPLQTLFPLFTLPNNFFLYGVRDSSEVNIRGVSVRLEVKVRKVSFFLVSQFPSIRTISRGNKLNLNLNLVSLKEP